MEKRATVSIIIPCYNYAHLIPFTLKNIQAQTYQDWECIIIDDGSSDNTKEIVSEFTGRDERIKYLFQVNSGPSIARSYGLRESKGSYIQFLDADDLLEPGKIESGLKVFSENKDCDIVYSGARYFRSENEKINFVDTSGNNQHPVGKGDNMILPLLKGNFLMISAPLTKKSAFEKFGYFDEKLRYNEDWELWLRFAVENLCFCFDTAPDTKTLIRLHDSSHSTDVFKMYLFGLAASLKFRNRLRLRKFRKILVPKIDYHKKIIDKELLKLLKVDRARAIERAQLVFNTTGEPRYSRYVSLFKNMPFIVSLLYSKFAYLVCKLKNLILYA